MVTDAGAGTADQPSSARRLPDLSVIVPAVNGSDILIECLEALDRNTAPGLALEVLVINRCGDAVRRAVAAAAPAAIIHTVAADTTIPQMRAVGIRQARAGAVAIIEDHVMVPADWARRLVDALSSGAEVVGGSVDNLATSTVVDRAAFLCEYSHLLSPPPDTDAHRLTGNNVAYRRALVAAYLDMLDNGSWEDAVHAAMRRDGIRLTCRPDIVVGHRMHYRMTDYVTQRFAYSRVYAGARRDSMTIAGRMFRAVASIGLPPLLLARILVRTLASDRHRAALARTLPLLAVFVSAWAAGEMTGYIAGPGDAAARIR